MELVEVNCPRSLNLINSNDCHIIKNSNIKSIRQTIDIYDSISIYQEIKKDTGIIINSQTILKIDLEEQLKQLIRIFEKYVGIKINNLIVNIKENPILELKDGKNIYSGLIIALNDYFKCNLNIHELMYLTKNINYLIPYYIVGGYKKILNDGKVKKMEKNKFNKYFLFDLNTVSKEELLYIKSIVENYSNIEYIDNLENPFLASLSGTPATSIIHLKKEFPEMRINQYQNSFGNKVLIKYIK